MIAWWGWLLIWAGLGILLLGVIALAGWRLFRKALILLDDVGELASRAEILAVDETELDPPAIAVLQDLRVIHAREDARRARRSARRRQRHDARLARARRITTVDASTSRWPADWY